MGKSDLPWLIEILNLKRKLTLLNDFGLFVETKSTGGTRHAPNEILSAVLVALEEIGDLVDLLEHERTRRRAWQYAPLVVVVDEVVVVHDGEHDEGVALFVVGQRSVGRVLDAYVAVDVAASGEAIVRVRGLDAEPGDELEEVVRVERAG